MLSIKWKHREYVFLSAGKFMPGMEKLAGELFFPTNQQLFFTKVGSWFKEKKVLPLAFSCQA